MPEYVLDWTTANLDTSPGNTNDFVGTGTNTASVDVFTPVNGNGEQWGIGGAVGQGTLESDFPDQPTEVIVKFNEDMANVTFNLYDVDGNAAGGNLSWDDLVTITAVDAMGNPVTVIYTNLDGQTVSVPDGSIEGETNTAVSEFVTVTFSAPIASFTVTFTNGADHVDTGYVGIGDVSFDEAVPDCFVRGTMIETDRGEIAIEALAVGDLVRTADNGFQPIRWIGSLSVKAKGSKAPILFRKGTIGNTRDLLLSPAHRVMLQGWQSEVLFGKGELLASAQSLVNDSTIIRQSADDNVDYFHILFDTHEIIFSNGAATESYHPGNAAEAGTMAQEARNEIFSLFPELEYGFGSYGASVRSTLRPHEAALLKM
ncbi:MAG: Hint domain-containing protein [Rhodobacteraceae bacterium]|nr:Hint domain-containing protein [Paracoccaceae bacterium]